MSSPSVLAFGGGGRLAFGCAVLIYLIVYNEHSASCIIFATIFAAIYSSIAVWFKTSRRSLQIAYIRATNKFDYTCLFLSSWMNILAVLCACVILARTLSVCFDVMTGGLARISLLGRNAQENEPWPDVLGVAVVMLVSVMFMLGLEHTRTFTQIMVFGVFGLSCVLGLVTWWNVDTQQSLDNLRLPAGLKNFLRTSALLCFTFSCELCTNNFRRLHKYLMAFLGSAFFVFTILCMSLLAQNNMPKEYIAVPLLTLLNEHNCQKLVPAAACMLLLTASGAFLELFTELYLSIVKLATPEWKILSKQIGYESSTSGNPVLAVFIAGSLCAMLVFSCPLQHLCYVLAASQLCGDLLNMFYFLYIPFRPTFMEQAVNSSLSYSRLSTETNNRQTLPTKRSKWNLNFQVASTSKRNKRKLKNKKEVDKEWLLLGEPTSPCPLKKTNDIESTVLSDVDPMPSDFEFPDKSNNSDSDISTDIDAVVDEYRQKIEVTTTGHTDQSLHLPSVLSWRITMGVISLVAFGISFSVIGLQLEWNLMFIVGALGVLILSILMNIIPRFQHGSSSYNPMLCCNMLLINTLLLNMCLDYSWVAILCWLLGGLSMLLRCDQWCCNCFEDTLLLDEELSTHIAVGKSTTTTTIRLPRPPKVIMTLPAHLTGKS